MLLGGAAFAQDTAGTDHSIDVHLFQSAVGPRAFITLPTAQVPAHKQFGVALVSNYQRGAFSIDVTPVGGESNRFHVVRDQVVSELTGAIGLLDQFEIGLAIPLTLYLEGQNFTTRGEPDTTLSAAGVGDIRLEGKARLAKFGPHKEFTFTVAPGLTVPSGNGDKFLGDRNVTGYLRALTEFRLDERLRAVAMAGYLVRQKSTALKSAVGSQALYGVGVDYRVHPQVSLLGEMFGRLGSTRWVDVNPLEIDAGMRVSLPKMLNVSFGGGGGLNRGIGSPLFRAFLAVGWAPDFSDRDADGVYDIEDRCPNDPEDRDGHQDTDGCPEVDNDGDGILDAQDRCPLDAEDIDQFQDEDGCPEADNDGDGIPDLHDPCPNAAEDGAGKRPKDGCPSTSEDSDGDGVVDANDKCPDEPEDRDGFQDYDGCPDLDNDDDGIPDGFDSCPSEGEDADGFEDSDGCPDPDNDKDGISDAMDKCPDQPETLNGNKDDDGCPDAGAELVRLQGDKIEVRGRISFVKAAGPPQVAPTAAAVIKLIGMLLTGHRELAVVRIELFENSVSKEETQARAEAIRVALIGSGVAAERLKAVGMGGGASRVDFLIEQKAEPRKAPAAAPPPKEE